MSCLYFVLVVYINESLADNYLHWSQMIPADVDCQLFQSNIIVMYRHTQYGSSMSASFKSNLAEICLLITDHSH